MAGSVRWGIAALGVVTAFFVTWWLCRLLVPGLGLDVALSLAGLATAVVSLPASVWAGKDRLDRGSERQPVHGGKGSRAVIVGEIPQEPPAFQRRPALEEQLAATERVAVVTALTGGPGMGKTQLAAAVARGCISAGWTVVAWIVAENAGMVMAGMDQLARALGLAVGQDDSEAAARKARNWLESQASARTLVVLDNVLDAETVRRWIPAVGQTRVIITSTSRSCDDLGTPVRVDTFTPAQSTAFLRQRTGLTDDTDARALAEDLDFLPLALAQVAAVVRSQHLSYATVLGRIRAVPLDRLLTRLSGDPYPRGAAEAVMLALRSVAEADRLAWPLVGLIAILSPAGISRDLLHHYADPDHGSDPVTAVEIDMSTGRLADASLLTFTLDGTAVLMHRFTQRVARDRAQREGTLAGFVLIAARLIANCRPTGEPAAHRELCLQLIMQTDALWAHAESGATDGTAMTDAMRLILELRRWSTTTLWALGNGSAAIAHGLSAVADHGRLLGADCEETMQASYGLALAYGQDCRHDEAIALNQQIVNWHIANVGTESPTTLNFQNTLANNYLESGIDFGEPARLETAISLHTGNLEQCSRAFGPDDDHTIRSGMNLARAYVAAGRAGDAVPLAEEMLNRAQHAFGPSHLLTLTTMYALAMAYAEYGQAAEALALIGQAIASAESIGAAQTNIWFYQQHQAKILVKAGQLDKAIAQLKELASEYSGLLGDDSAAARRVLEDLANAYEKAGRIPDAITTLEKVMKTCSLALGPDSPMTQRIAAQLAKLRSQGSRKLSLAGSWNKRVPHGR